MIYHKWRMIGLMLWLWYALLAGRPWRSLRSIYAEHLESPGTKAYSYIEARQLLLNSLPCRFPGHWHMVICLNRMLVSGTRK